MSDETPEQVAYRSADIYFVFSFVLDFARPFHTVSSELARGTESGSWISGPPHNRRGKAPFLVIERQYPPDSGNYIGTSMSKLIRRTQDVTLEYKEENFHASPSKAKLEGHVRIFKSGAASITYRVGVDDPTLRLIHQILSLSQRRSEGFGESVLRGAHIPDRGYLHDIFVNDLEKVEGELASFAQVQDRKVMDLGRKREDPSQNPYVLSVLELERDPGTGRVFWEPEGDQDPDLVPKYKELVSILLRMFLPSAEFEEHLQRLRIPYELRNQYGTLKNYAWDSRVMMCFTGVSTLFACPDKNSQPESFLVRSLLDTVEIIRTRWHMSILLNAVLDQDMESIRDTASSDNLDSLDQLIQRRRQFAYFLDDPLPYNFEGGSVTRIVDAAETEMGLERLKESTRRKLEVLDKLYSDQMDYIRAIEFRKQIDEKLKAGLGLEERLKQIRARKSD